jgi:PAS domain S-box-containing protein
VSYTAARIAVLKQFSVEPTIQRSRVELPTGNFTTVLLRTRTEYAFSPRMFMSALVQYSSADRSFSSNVRYRWEYKLGSELFVVYTDDRDTSAAAIRRSRTGFMSSRSPASSAFDAAAAARPDAPDDRRMWRRPRRHLAGGTMDSDDRGREWLRTTLYSIGDAVVTTDAPRAGARDEPGGRGAHRLDGGGSGGRLFAEVFVAFNEDLTPIVDPVAQILRDGVTIGLANHTLLRGRHGRACPIADSGAPIRDRDGRLLGAVIVFRDQTAERMQLRALEESERRHRELFAANPQAMWVYDDDTLAFLDVNGAAIARYGYTRDEFLAMTLADIRPSEDVAALLEDVKSVPDGFDGGRRWRHRRRDGSLLTVEIRRIPCRARARRVVLVHDVTAQTALETRLHWQAQILTRLASREPLDTLLADLAIFVCTLCPGVMSTVMLFDAAAGVLRPAASHRIPPEVQAAADPTPVADLTGVWHGGVTARAVRRGGHRDRPGVHGVSAGDPALRPARGVVTSVLRYPRPPARHRGDVRARPRPADADRDRRRGVRGYPGRRDGGAFAEPRRPQRARGAAAAHLRERAGIRGGARPRRPSARDESAGLRQIEADAIDDVRGTDVGALVTPECREAFSALTRDVAAGGDGRLEFELVGLKGTRRWLETHAAPLRDAQGRITAVLGITRDVTERKALAAQLLQSQKLESVGRLAGGVAHDFNNMLGVIQGQTELALQDAPPGSLLESGLREVLKAAQRSAQLTRQLLAFARREPSTPRVLDLNLRVQELLGMLARLIGEGVVVSWQPGDDLWPVRIDPGQLDQVLTNLVVNARDAMAGAGALTVTTANTRREAEDGATAGDYVVLTVRDTGAGMDAATRARIFEPFFTTKPLGQGTGLGLSTVYGIARQHGGAIEVESRPGQGATFRLFLPKSIESPAPLAESNATPSATGGRGTILLVEDEPALLALTGRVLRREGYTVLAAASPIEAEGVVGHHDGPIDLLLTDMVMPGMNGRELWRRVRALRPSMCCLIMSGYSHDGMEGTTDLDVVTLHKPFAMHELIAQVRAALAAGASPAEARAPE